MTLTLPLLDARSRRRLNAGLYDYDRGEDDQKERGEKLHRGCAETQSRTRETGVEVFVKLAKHIYIYIYTCEPTQAIKESPSTSKVLQLLRTTCLAA